MLSRTFCFPIDPGSLLVNSVASVFTCSVASARVSWNSTTSSVLKARSVDSVTCSISSAFCGATAVGFQCCLALFFRKSRGVPSAPPIQRLSPPFVLYFQCAPLIRTVSSHYTLATPRPVTFICIWFSALLLCCPSRGVLSPFLILLHALLIAFAGQPLSMRLCPFESVTSLAVQV